MIPSVRIKNDINIEFDVYRKNAEATENIPEDFSDAQEITQVN